MKPKTKRQHRLNRHRRVRAKIQGTAQRPRVSVFKSNQYVYAQVIDDEIGKTLISVSDQGTKAKSKKSDAASKAGETLAKKMKEKGITEALFDRGGFKFHGRVKAVADGLRKGGIKI